jgi:hypothetical protein
VTGAAGQRAGVTSRIIFFTLTMTVWFWNSTGSSAATAISRYRLNSSSNATRPSSRASGASGADAEMDAVAEGQTRIRRPADVEHLGVGELRGVPVG